MKISWKKPKEKKGILVAFDATLQPLIFWWYQSLRKYSSLPIAFVDLGGVSNKVKNWCKKNGYYINCEKYVAYFKKIKVPEKNKKKWQEITSVDISVVESIRPYWFTKPIAMMHTPFEETLYLDIDCEVKDFIDSIFSCLDKNEMGLSEDIKSVVKENDDNLNIITFNSGVIAYRINSQVIGKWTELSFKISCDFWGDQDLLSYVIDKYKYKPEILPTICNWPVFLQGNNLIKILHWIGHYKITLLKNIKTYII